MMQDLQLTGRGGRIPPQFARWFMAGLLGLATAWASVAAAVEPVGEESQGITVHGDWTITVSDSDGREVSTRSFRNALLPSGEALLVLLLSLDSQIDRSLSNWHILVLPAGTVDNEECNALTGVPIPVGTLFGAATLASLSLNDERTTFTLERDLKLPATCIAGAGYSISEVWSAAQYRVISGSFIPDASELTPRRSPFTKKVLDSPVDVLPGQVVSLSVTFSFS